MNTSEEFEMLELCEPELDELKSTDDFKSPENLQTDASSNVLVETVDPPQHKSEVSTTDLLYSSLGINSKDQKIFSNIRLDTIHILGVDEMSTKDVYGFFEPMKPIALEWINDSSCNVVWADEKSASDALLKFTKPTEEQTQPDMESEEKLLNPIEEAEKENAKDSNQIVMVDEDEDDESSEEGELTDQKEPEKIIWRIANSKNEKPLKLRYATWDDKKVRGAEKFSAYYKKYGNPNFGGLKGLISNSRKRKFRENPPTENLSDSDVSQENDDNGPEDARLRISHLNPESEKRDTLPKRPKMKMYADEEERKTQRQKSNKVSNRLGSITVNFSMERKREDDYDELEVSSPQEFGSKSVWDRLQVEVPNSRYSSTDDKKRGERASNHKSSDQASQRDLRKKLQRIRNSRRDHRSPLLVETKSE